MELLLENLLAEFVCIASGRSPGKYKKNITETILLFIHNICGMFSQHITLGSFTETSTWKKVVQILFGKYICFTDTLKNCGVNDAL